MFAPKTTPVRRRKGNTFPPCRLCGKDEGFTWSCSCGFSTCSECMNDNLQMLRSTGRQWVCPTCGKCHIGANR